MDQNKPAKATVQPQTFAAVVAIRGRLAELNGTDDQLQQGIKRGLQEAEALILEAVITTGRP
jgi:hypothetical protein